MAALIRAIDWYVHLTMIVSVGLIIASFIVPPLGTVDGSVLRGVGELGSMAAVFTFLARLPEYIKAGATARIQRGSTSIEVGRKDANSNDDKETETEYETE